MAMQPKRPRVFISATQKDQSLARVLAEKLRAAGLEPWTIDEITPGQSVLEVVSNAVRSSQAMVILLTPHSVQNSYMLVEVGAAWGSGKPVAVILAGVAADEIPSPLKQLSTVFPIDRFDDAVQQLEQSLTQPA
jgi:hypothetical protein